MADNGVTFNQMRRYFGAPRFLRSVTEFLILARDEILMNDHELQQWDRALVGEDGLTDTDDDSSDDDDDADACLNDETELGDEAEEDSNQEQLSRQDRSQAGRPKRRRGDKEEEDAGDSESPPDATRNRYGSGLYDSTPCRQLWCGGAMASSNW
jgi:hypothetical protein